MNLKGLSRFSCALLLMVLTCTGLYAQERKVTGRVVDQQDRQPIPGVNVSIKGKPSNVSTNSDGVFTIQVDSDADALVFSYIGYVRQTIPVGKQATINVSLASDNKDLDEVVVVGYGTQKKIHLTGAVETINVKQIEDLPVGSLSAALRGQAPGVSVSGGYSRPGDNASIVIRNPQSFAKDGPQGAGNPLYVIDDVIRTPDDFNLLDASEVENISILKDASAAIYGIQGANGVIVVTTKRGRKGETRITYGGSAGVSDAIQLPDMMSGVDHAIYLNDYNMSRGNPTPLDIYTPDELEYFKNNSTDWLKQAWQTAVVSRHTLNISGGSDKATFFAGGSYVNQNANFKGINTDRWTFRASSDIKLTQGLQLGLSLSGDLATNRRFFYKQGTESAENDFLTLLGNPEFVPYYINGLPVLINSRTGNTESFHFFEAQKSDNFSNSRGTGFNVLGNLQYAIPFVKGLNAKVTLSKNLDNNFGKQFGTFYDVYRFSMLGENKHIYGGDVIGTTRLKNGDRIRISPSYTDSYQLNGSLNYSREFGKHSLSALALYEQQESEFDSVDGMVEGIIEGGLPNQNFGTGVNTSTELQTEFGRLAYAGRINYSYDNKYLLELSIRADANVNFAPGKRWGYFPSVSAGWIVSDEGFFKNKVKGVDFLKLRGSIGFLGTDNTKGYQYLVNYAKETSKSAVFGGNGNIGPSFKTNNAIGNPNLSWDENTKMNAGLDAKFLKNKLSLTVDGFLDKRRNMLSTRTSSVPAVIGAKVPTENYASVNSFGYEISLGWKDEIDKNWSYYVNSFLSWSDNKQLLFDQDAGRIGTYLDGTGLSSDRGTYGYRYQGMFRTQEQVDSYLASNPGYKLFGKTPEPGMLYYKDIRGPYNSATKQFDGPDGVITEQDQDFLTNKADNHYGLGLNFGTSYKTLSLSVVMGMSFGGQGSVEGAARKRAQTYSNRPAFWADHWTPENTDAAYPGPEFEDTYDKESEFWFKSSYSFRVSNFNLSYGLPQRITQKIGINSAKIFLIGTNPINFFNPYDYRDNASAYNVYPNLRTFSLGVNIGL